MINKISKRVIAALISTLVRFVIGAAIRFFMKESHTSFSNVLFWVGAVPILVFSMASFGNFFGRGNPSYQMSRSVTEESSNQRARQDLKDIEFMVKSGLNWILAGLLLWLISCFI